MRRIWLVSLVLVGPVAMAAAPQPADKPATPAAPAAITYAELAPAAHYDVSPVQPASPRSTAKFDFEAIRASNPPKAEPIQLLDF